MLIYLSLYFLCAMISAYIYSVVAQPWQLTFPKSRVLIHGLLWPLCIIGVLGMSIAYISQYLAIKTRLKWGKNEKQN